MISENIITWIIGGAGTIAVGAITASLKIGQTYGKLISEFERNDEEKARFVKASEKLDMIPEIRASVEFMKDVVREVPRMKSSIESLRRDVAAIQAGNDAYRTAMESIHDMKNGE